jgi:hypothetical protein
MGGDFYDVIEPSLDEVLLIVGDYSGKGLEAAGMASRARYTLALLALQSNGPADLFNRANDRLAALLRYDRYVSGALSHPSSTGDLRLTRLAPGPLFLKDILTCR